MVANDWVISNDEYSRGYRDGIRASLLVVEKLANNEDRNQAYGALENACEELKEELKGLAR